MAMTRTEFIAKGQVIDQLRKEGYATYAKLFDYFDLNLTSDPSVVAYMIPNKGVITLNRGLDIEQVSVCVRHEILHEFFTHLQRMEQHVGKNIWDKRSSVMQNIANIAGDFEISNRAYTERDKINVRNLLLNGEYISALVTEDHHPDWVDLTLEEMYDRLIKELKNDPNMLIQPRIGDTGDAQIQAAEEVERQANDISDELEQDEFGDSGLEDSDTPDGPSSNNSKKAAKKVRDKADDLADAAGKLADDIEQAKDEAENSGKVFQDEKEAKKAAKLEKRLAKIRELLGDLETQKAALEETKTQIEKERIQRAASQYERESNSPLSRFIKSINQFIKRELSTGRGDSWSRFNKRYTELGLIKPGSSRNALKKIPSINVYFDNSSSWDEDKIQVGKDAIGTLKKYENRKVLKLHVYYFTTYVSDTPIDGGGTSGAPILEHIQKTRPDNVIVMTDSDISDCTEAISVPGGVWFLFKGGISNNIMNHLQGLKLTKMFELD